MARLRSKTGEPLLLPDLGVTHRLCVPVYMMIVAPGYPDGHENDHDDGLSAKAEPKKRSSFFLLHYRTALNPKLTRSERGVSVRNGQS